MSPAELRRPKSSRATSHEYFERRGGGTINGFLNAIFLAVVQRPPHPQTARILSRLLARGQASRQDVAALFLAIPEARRLQVQGYYKTFLRRRADPVRGPVQGRQRLAAWVA
jgi:hypothetical protein